MNRATKIGIAAAVAVFMVMGVAIAAWLVQGTGTGSAKAGTAVPLTVSPGTAAGDLYPGSIGGDVYVTVTNTNAFPVTLTGATIAGPVTPANCLVTVNEGPFNFSAPSVPIAAGSTANVTIVNALSMGLTADDSCQGASLAVTDVTVTGVAG